MHIYFLNTLLTIHLCITQKLILHGYFKISQCAKTARKQGCNRGSIPAFKLCQTPPKGGGFQSGWVDFLGICTTAPKKNLCLFSRVFFLYQTPFYKVTLGAKGVPKIFGLVFKEGVVEGGSAPPPPLLKSSPGYNNWHPLLPQQAGFCPLPRNA